MTKLISILLDSLTDKEIESDSTIVSIYNYTSLNTEEECEIVFKYQLRHSHIKSLIFEDINRICKLFCKECYKILNISDNSSLICKNINARYKYLYGHLQYSSCNCTGKTKYEYKDILDIYKKLDESGLCEILDIPRRDKVITKYCLMLSRNFLENQSSGLELLKSYQDLIDSKYKDINSEYNHLNSIIKKTAKALKGKEGIIRNNMLPTYPKNSGRAVITCDNYIDTDQIFIPDHLIESLQIEYRVEEDNFYNILEKIIKGEIKNIIHEKNYYEISRIQNNIYIRIYVNTNDGIYKYCLYDKSLIYYKDNICTVDTIGIIKAYKLISNGEISFIIDNNVKYYINSKECYIIIRCNTIILDEVYQKDICFDIGILVKHLPDNNNMLLHRNPVMFGNSMLVHRSYMKYNNSEYKSTLEDYIIQKSKNYKYISINNSVNLNNDILTTYSDQKEDFLLTINGKSTTIFSVKNNPEFDINNFYNVIDINKGYDKNKLYDTNYKNKNTTLGIHYSTVISYNGDFDGDMMNIKSLSDNIGDSMNATNNFIDRDVGINYDSQFGLFAIINDKDDRITKYDIMNSTDNEEIAIFLCSLLNNNKYIYLYQKPKSFNNFIIEYHKNNNILTKLEKFINYIHRSLNTICDNYGLTYDMNDKTMALKMVESKCKPSNSSYNSIYKNIGIVKCLMPSNEVHYINISNNYSKGINDKEMDYLCITARNSAVTKALKTPKEGNDMRLNSNFWSNVKIKDNIYTENNHEIMRYCNEDYYSYMEQRKALLDPVIFYKYLDEQVLEFSTLLKYSADRKSYILTDNILNNVYINEYRGNVLSDIQFLTFFCENSKNTMVIYNKVSNDNRISILHRLFPKILFILYDSNKNNFHESLYSNNTLKDNIIIKNYDINSVIDKEYNYITSMKRTNILIIDNDIEFNINMLKIIKPNYYTRDIEFPNDDNNTILINGKFMLRCYNNRFSTKVRLLSSYENICNNMIKYDNRYYSSKMYYHNIKRSQKCPGNIIKQLEKDMKKEKKKRNHDTILESHIIENYVRYRLKESNKYIENIVDYESNNVYNLIVKNI